MRCALDRGRVGEEPLEVIQGHVRIGTARQDAAERMAEFIEGVETEGEQIKTGLIVLSRIFTYTIAFLATVLATGLLYYFGPNRPLKFRSVWPGAFLATVLWMLGTSGFAWYVRNIANYNLLYGSLGAVIALLVWMYVMAIVALIGCEFNAERERLISR